MYETMLFVSITKGWMEIVGALKLYNCPIQEAWETFTFHFLCCHLIKILHVFSWDNLPWRHLKFPFSSAIVVSKTNFCSHPWRGKNLKTKILFKTMFTQIRANECRILDLKRRRNYGWLESTKDKGWEGCQLFLILRVLPISNPERSRKLALYFIPLWTIPE